MVRFALMRNVTSDTDLKLKVLLSELHDCNGNDDPHWLVRPLSHGEQAQLFCVRRDTLSGCGLRENLLIVKLFKNDSPANRHAFQREKIGLRILYECLHGNRYEGWVIHCPQLLHNFENPLALVMSSVPGKPLQAYLHSHDIALGMLQRMSRVILQVLQVYWSRGELYGDLNLKNILIDPEGLSLAFVDPGMPEDYYRCVGATTKWYLMSRDLAYLLFSVAVSVKTTFGSPDSWRRQQLLVLLLLRQFLDSIPSVPQKEAFLVELRQCLDIHLQMLDCSWLPSGVWRRLVRHITQTRISQALKALAPSGNGLSA